MIIVKNRELLIPNNERYIGTTYDNDTENRVFQVPRFSQRGVDLANLTFRLDIQYANEAFDTVVLGKEVGETFIILIWKITSATLQVPGTLYIGIRAVDSEATVKWSSFSAAMYAERHLNTPGNYTGNLTEIEQMEQDHVYMKGVVDELKSNLDYAHDAEAWAQGTRSGAAVPSTDKTYHKNSKYYSEQASAKATQAANSATAAANSATQAAETVTDTNTRFNNAVAAVTVNTEVKDARVGADGTTYTVLKNRLDAEHTNLKSALSESENGKRYISGIFNYGIFNSSNMPESDPRKFNAVMMTAEKYNRDIIITAKTGYNFLTYWYNDSDVYVGKSLSWETSRIIPSNTNFRLWVRPNPLDTSIILDLNTVKENIIFNTKINDDVEKNTNDIATEKQNLYAVADGISFIDTVFVYGKMNTSTGAVIPDTTKYQVVMPNYVKATKDIKIDCNTGYRYQVWWYTDQDVYISRTASFKVAGEKYTVSAGTNFRLFVTLDPPNIQAVVPVDTFAKNVFMQTGIQSQIKAIREKPLTTLPTYILNNAAEKPLGSLSKGYILLSFDDGAKTLATGTIPLLIENNVPGTFGLLPESAIFASGNESELATVVDAVENHGCVVAMHGSALWPTYTESALNAYFDSTIALFMDNDLGDTYGAICPGGNGDDTSALVKAVAGGKFGYVFSGNRVGKISYDATNADGKYNGARSNRFDLDRISGIGITTAKVQAIVNYAAENHLLLCPFWHDNTLNNENHPEYITYFNALISAAKDAGLTFITTKDLPNIT